MPHFARNSIRFSARPRRWGVLVPLPPGVLPGMVLLTESGDGLTGQDGKFLLLELATGQSIELGLLSELAQPMVTQASVYLKQE